MATISAAERERRSQLAKQLHREGRLGTQAITRKAAARSAEVRSRRASTLAARLVEQHEAKIERAIVAGLDSKNVGQKLKAAELIMRMGLAGERTDVTAVKAEAEHMDRQQLLQVLSEKLTTGVTGTILSHHLAQRVQQEAIEGQAVEVEHELVAAKGDIPPSGDRPQE